MLRSAHFSCLSVDVALLSARRDVSNPELLKKEHYFADSSRIIQETDASDVCCGWNNIYFRVSPQRTAGYCLRRGWWEGNGYRSKNKEVGRAGQNENKVHWNICWNLLLLHVRGTVVPRPSEFLRDIWNMAGEKEKKGERSCQNGSSEPSRRTAKRLVSLYKPFPFTSTRHRAAPFRL